MNHRKPGRHYIYSINLLILTWDPFANADSDSASLSVSMTTDFRDNSNSF